MGAFTRPTKSRVVFFNRRGLTTDKFYIFAPLIKGKETEFSLLIVYKE